MKDNLITDLDDIFNHLTDYRSRLLHYLLDADFVRDLDDDVVTKIKNIRSSISYVEDLITEVRNEIDKRVYCIQVTTTIDMIIKVLAKNEHDAIEWAERTADLRIEDKLANHFDCDAFSSEGYLLGDESPNDDDADEEYEYDE